MNGRVNKLPMMTLRVPDVAEAEQCVQQVRQLFAQTLAGWASDALELRRMQLHLLEWRPNRTETWSKAA